MTTHRSVGRRIAARRAEAGLSQAVVARRAGLDPSYLSKIEKGRIHPTIRMAERIAGAMRIPLPELLGPSPESEGEGCPVTRSGRCLLDLVESGRPSNAGGGAETYTAAQFRLQARFAGVVHRSSPALLKALDALVREISTLQARVVS